MWLPTALPRNFGACERDVRSTKVDVRASAVTDLVRHARDPEHRARALELLAGALADEAPRVRARAALGLSDGWDRDAGPHPELDALLARVDDDDDEVRQLAITALGEIGDPRAVPRLLRAAEDARPSMRYQALIALGGMSAVAEETRLKALLRGSSDEDDHVRYIAMRLGEERFAKTGAAPERLRRRAVALLDDEDPNVALAAALLLGHAGDDRAKPLLGRVVRGEVSAEPEDEREAVELAGALGMSDLVPALERRAFGLGRHLRDTCAFHATIALARMGHARAVALIKRDLESGSDKRREAAAVAAARAGVT